MPFSWRPHCWSQHANLYASRKVFHRIKIGNAWRHMYIWPRNTFSFLCGLDALTGLQYKFWGYGLAESEDILLCGQETLIYWQYMGIRYGLGTYFNVAWRHLHTYNWYYNKIGHRDIFLCDLESLADLQAKYKVLRIYFNVAWRH